MSAKKTTRIQAASAIKKAAKKTAAKTPAKKAPANGTTKSTGNFKHLAPFVAAVAQNVANNSDFCTTSGRNAFKAQNRTPTGNVIFSHVDSRTRAMLFCQQGLTHINPTAPLLTPAERRQLKGPINAGWFDDVGCNIGDAALTAANTLNKLENAIYAACAQTA